MTETSQSQAYGTTDGKGRVGLFLFLVLLTLVAAALITVDALSGEKAEFTDQLDPTTLEDAPD